MAHRDRFTPEQLERIVLGAQKLTQDDKNRLQPDQLVRLGGPRLIELTPHDKNRLTKEQLEQLVFGGIELTQHDKNRLSPEQLQRHGFTGR